MLAVKHNASDGMMLSVAKSDEGQCHRMLGCEFLRWPGKYEKRFVARIFADADVAPTHRFADGIGWHSNIFRTIAVSPQGCGAGVRN